MKAKDIQAYKPNSRHLDNVSRQKLRQTLNIIKSKTSDIKTVIEAFKKIKEAIPQKYSVQPYGSNQVDASDYIEKDESLIEETYEALDDFILAFMIAVEDGGK